MSNDELYQDVILDHNKNPRNFGKIDKASSTAEGVNPLCGDSIQLYIRMNGDVIEDISFESTGCAISKASASIMGEALKGKTTKDAEKLFKSFYQLVTGEGGEKIDESKLGELAAFSGVRQFPIRVKCATLAWRALQAALARESSKVSTE